MILYDIIITGKDGRDRSFYDIRMFSMTRGTLGLSENLQLNISAHFTMFHHPEGKVEVASEDIDILSIFSKEIE